MSEGTRSQFYKYTLKCDAYLNGTFCTRRAYAYPVPPENALTIENVFVHFRITFDSAVAVGDRIVEAIGISNTRPVLYSAEPSDARIYEINQAADANRVVDLKVDLSALLDRDKVDYDSLFEADYATGDKTFVYIRLPIGLIDTLNVGTIDIWKIDSVWTTREIR